MTDDLRGAYRRWRAAEELDDEEGADQAFGAIFNAAVPAPLPSRDFVARTMAVAAAAADADARRARRTRTALRWVLPPALVILIYLGAGPLVSLLSSALVSSLNLLVSLVVTVADDSGARRTAWSVLGGIGRAAAALVDDPRVTVAMLGCQALAVAALVALHRLLGSGREWLR